MVSAGQENELTTAKRYSSQAEGRGNKGGGWSEQTAMRWLTQTCQSRVVIDDQSWDSLLHQRRSSFSSSAFRARTEAVKI